MFYQAKNGQVQIGEQVMEYISFGKGARKLIMLPGLGDGLKTAKGMAIPFALLYRQFAKDFTVYVCSRKNNLPEGYTIAQMAKDQAEAMEKLGIDCADIIGVSQGGAIAQELALTYPDKVGKLILVVTFAGQNTTLQTLMEKWIEMARKEEYAKLMIDNFENSYSEGYLKKYRMFYPIITKIGKPRSFDRFIIQAQSILTHKARERLAEISHPTLIVGGRQDKIVTVEESLQMAETIPNSELYIYEDFGHGLYEEGKDFIPRVLEFLKN